MIQDECLLRGVDYRAPGTGIGLVIACSFSTNRTLVQALGRVGIFKESFERVQLAGLYVVNEWTDNTAFNALFKFVNEINQEKALA